MKEENQERKRELGKMRRENREREKILEGKIEKMHEELAELKRRFEREVEKIGMQSVEIGEEGEGEGARALDKGELEIAKRDGSKPAEKVKEGGIKREGKKAGGTRE